MINKTMILGELIKCEAKSSSTGQRYFIINIKCSSHHYKNGELKEYSEYINFLVFGANADKLAQIVPTIGDHIYCEGKIANKKGDDGRYAMEFTCLFIDKALEVVKQPVYSSNGSTNTQQRLPQQKGNGYLPANNSSEDW
jgi:single-stranded DNA-binding protein